MSNIMNWLDARAGDWIKAGKKRVPVEVEPPIGWSVTGSLVPGVSQSSQQVQLQAKFVRQMQTHTIQFDGADNSIILPLAATLLTRAEILWGVEGSTIRRLIDIQDGASISGVAQSVTVNIFDRSDSTVSPNNAYRVSCLVAPGVRSQNQPPLLRPQAITSTLPTKLQDYAVSLAAGASATWLVPTNAGVISTYTTAFVAGAVTLVENSVSVSHIAAGGGFANRYGLSGCYRYVPVMGNTASIRLDNNSGENGVVVSCLFGVDG
jgi:hypothetical protein